MHMDLLYLKYKQALFLLLIFNLFSLSASAEQVSQPTISIIIDDLGYRFQEDLRALALPGPVAYAILPHAPHTEKMSQIAYQKGKDILLHQPMQAMKKNQYLGPGALTLNMTREEFLQTLIDDSIECRMFAGGIGSVDKAVGIAEELDLYGIGLGREKYTREDIDYIHSKGLWVIMWDAKSREENIDALTKNPDIIQTDKPIHLLKLLGRFKDE